MSKKIAVFDEGRISSCLTVIRQLYIDYTPDEIAESFAINRKEITAREERIRLENELKNIQSQLDTPTE